MPSAALPPLRIGYADFWPGFDPQDNSITRLLSTRRTLVFDQTDPDFLIFSCFGQSHADATFDRAVKIFITGENIAPDFNACDYAVSFEKLEYGDRHVRFPLYAGTDEARTLFNRPDVDREFISGRKKFCNFVYSNRRFASPERSVFFHELNRLHAVISAGRFLSNHPKVDELYPQAGRREAKMRFLSLFRFTIAFENSEHSGYATEKITDAFAARTIPIYWGDPDIADEFNPDSFVNARAFPDMASVARRVVEIDNDPDAMLAMLNAPVFPGGHDRVSELRHAYEDFLFAILERRPEEARRRPRHGHYAMRQYRTRQGPLRRFLRAIRTR